MFLSFHDNKNEKMLFPKFIYKVKKNNKNLGDIKCVEVKRVFCIKHEKKNALIKKKRKVVILSAQLLNLYQKGGWGGMTC